MRRLLQRQSVRHLFGIAAACVVLFLMAAALIAFAGLTDSAARSDVVVVLGNEVLADGTPSPRLAARLDAAARIHAGGLADNIIVSGGIGASGFSEADVMADYLVSAGVDADQILIDSEGVTTRATATNAAALMEERGWTSVIVATQFFHIPRTQLAFEQAGVESVTTTHADHFELRDVYGLAREVPAYLRYWLIG